MKTYLIDKNIGWIYIKYRILSGLILAFKLQDHLFETVTVYKFVGFGRATAGKSRCPSSRQMTKPAPVGPTFFSLLSSKHSAQFLKEHPSPTSMQRCLKSKQGAVVRHLSLFEVLKVKKKNTLSTGMQSIETYFVSLAAANPGIPVSTQKRI